MDKLFSKYPSIFYNGLRCVDLSKRVKLTDVGVRNTNLYYPLELKAGLRPDVLADAYYNDSELDWLIYLTNEIVDPYYQWYLNDSEFKQFIIDKYGSIEASIKKIKFYRNNWASDRREIDPRFYEENLALKQKQYYTPNYAVNGRIISYKRKEEDWVTATNKIVQFDIELTDNLYEHDEIVDIKNSINETVGGGTVIESNTSAIIIKHVSGDIYANTTNELKLVGESSNVESVSNNSVVLADVITNADAIFWEPVSWYDWETEQNESRKHITVLNSAYTIDVSEKIRELMHE